MTNNYTNPHANQYRKGTHYPESYNFGIQRELANYPHLKLCFGADLVHHLNDPSAAFDFSNTKWNLEQKARKYKSTDFDTLEISLNKCVLADGKKTGFLMDMIDGIFFIKYNAKLFESFAIINKARDGIEGAEKDTIYIPTKLFKKIVSDHRPSENGCLIKMRK